MYIITRFGTWRVLDASTADKALEMAKILYRSGNCDLGDIVNAEGDVVVPWQEIAGIPLAPCGIHYANDECGAWCGTDLSDNDYDEMS